MPKLNEFSAKSQRLGLLVWGVPGKGVQLVNGLTECCKPEEMVIHTVQQEKSRPPHYRRRGWTESSSFSTDPRKTPYNVRARR